MSNNSLADKQSERFVQTAKQLGCDEDESSFKAKLAVIARQRPAKPTEATASSETCVKGKT